MRVFMVMDCQGNLRRIRKVPFVTKLYDGIALISMVIVCSATAPVSYPTTLRNFPNGCQGHPRSYPPPDRPSFTKPDSNSVRTRLQIFIQLRHRLTKKCISVLKPENRKRSI
jgi:hypothetical protein